MKSKTIFEWAEMFQEQILNGASKSDIIQMLQEYGNEALRIHDDVSCRKIMEQEKRYVALVEFYVFAKTDEEAIKQVKKQCKEQDDKNDDRCELIKLVEQPFATLGNRIVYVS